MPLKPGKKAPHFSLHDQDSILRTLSLVFAPFTVVHFSAKSSEIKEFNKNLSSFHSLGAQVFAISSQNIFPKLDLPVLSDKESKITQAYGVSSGKETTFILNQDKTIIQVFEKQENHTQKVLDYIKSLS